MIRFFGIQAVVFKNPFVVFSVGLQFNRRWLEVWIAVGTRSLIIGPAPVRRHIENRQRAKRQEKTARRKAKRDESPG